MADEFALLLGEIKRVLPESWLAPLDEVQLTGIQQKYPEVPNHYLAYLRHVGHGTLGDSFFAVYSGLCKPSDFFDAKTATDLAGILFLGDDFAGWMLGFDTRNNWQIVGVDSGWPKPHPEVAQTVAEFVTLLVQRESQDHKN